MTDHVNNIYTFASVLERRRHHRKHLLLAIRDRNRRGFEYRRLMLLALRDLDRAMRQRGVV